MKNIILLDCRGRNIAKVDTLLPGHTARYLDDSESLTCEGIGSTALRLSKLEDESLIALLYAIERLLDQRA